MPPTTMLCTLSVEACKGDGSVIARNFVHYFVSNGYPFNREEMPRSLILRGAPPDWANAEWSGESSSRKQARARDYCFGHGHGFFEWFLPLENANLAKARRMRILCEASSRRIDTPQTDYDIFPTTLQISLNGIPVYEATLRNHPHDARGVLSYLRGGRGAYGFLAHAFAEGELLERIVSANRNNHLGFRCGVPADTIPEGGLTIYGAQCGRYPLCPTVIVEW